MQPQKQAYNRVSKYHDVMVHNKASQILKQLAYQPKGESDGYVPKRILKECPAKFSFPLEISQVQLSSPHAPENLFGGRVVWAFVPLARSEIQPTIPVSYQSGLYPER